MAVLVPVYELTKTIGRSIEIDADTVGELIDKGIALYGEAFARTTTSCLIVVNGIAIHSLRGRKTKLTAKDEVWFLKPSGGG